MTSVHVTIDGVLSAPSSFCSQSSKKWVMGLFPVAFITNYSKHGGLKPHTCVIVLQILYIFIIKGIVLGLRCLKCVSLSWSQSIPMTQLLLRALRRAHFLTLPDSGSFWTLWLEVPPSFSKPAMVIESFSYKIFLMLTVLLPLSST